MNIEITYYVPSEIIITTGDVFLILGSMGFIIATFVGILAWLNYLDEKQEKIWKHLLKK